MEPIPLPRHCYAINNNSTLSASGPSAAGAGSSTLAQGTQRAQPLHGSPHSYAFCMVAADSSRIFRQLARVQRRRMRLQPSSSSTSGCDAVSSLA